MTERLRKSDLIDKQFKLPPFAELNVSEIKDCAKIVLTERLLVNKESLEDPTLLLLTLTHLSLLPHWPRLTILILADDLAQHRVSVHHSCQRPHHTDLTGLGLTLYKAADQPPPVLVSDRGLAPALGSEGLRRGEGAEAQRHEDHVGAQQAALLCPHCAADWL